MVLKRMWALFMARNYEFIRDRAGFGWNILFPFLLVAAFSLAFGSDAKKQFKLGILTDGKPDPAIADIHIPSGLKTDPAIQMVFFDTKDLALEKLRHHKIDMVLQSDDPEKSQDPAAPGPPVLHYWVSDASPKGVLMEKLVKEAMVPADFFENRLHKQAVPGIQVRYIDWLFPGILGMNIMFSAFFGVGYVIVRYRRNGVLKRLKATPVTAFEYLSAQLVSRVLVSMIASFVVWAGCDVVFSFQMQGRFLDAAIVFLAGTVCLVSFGLILACRGTNEELTNGIINFICWPMMFLSEVWFSIEGAADWIKQAAGFLPLTHFLTAARKVINDGAALSQVSHEVATLAIMSVVFLAIGSVLFSWTK
ncbi:MAG: ABC transporter permease [Desulfotignum sp.]|jgi:ABC-type multidrug transport system permease subunit|nr:ABC transporter permease [Desulfotignum sp.]